MKIKLLFILFTLAFININAQKISGKIIDDNGLALSTVVVKNITNNKTVFSDSFGNFSVEANENDEIRFVKEGFYRTDRKVSGENITSLMNVLLLRAETLIPEVKIAYKPTGNLERDSKHYGDSKKLASLKSGLNDYMRSPLKEPLPKNEVSKAFTGHDFKVGQADLIGVFNLAKGLVKKATEPKITKPTYKETQDFINRVKSLDLSFAKKYGMTEEQIDSFLLYAEETRELSKKYRKTFNVAEIKAELSIAFSKYIQTNKVGN
ncbi:hypothetical protein [Chryseobacterium oryctis]|uniref:CarboxypepD_reg-like domain-containing protein n=1 Tax=Chryseobacterium oryctis TaxID=2952618 RepID=A0ABT3HQE0_9FLAO|nr:hypothetical protein [Chryseobacterium oryctis]MCW3162000.1 hypothetical protein [Chryseobacterium oryctis]